MSFWKAAVAVGSVSDREGVQLKLGRKWRWKWQWVQWAGKVLWFTPVIRPVELHNDRGRAKDETACDADHRGPPHLQRLHGSAAALRQWQWHRDSGSGTLILRATQVVLHQAERSLRRR